jgi:hypothetical protein
VAQAEVAVDKAAAQARLQPSSGGATTRCDKCLQVRETDQRVGGHQRG